MTPPRGALWLLETLLDADAAEAIAGDLIEGFQSRAATSGAARARRWFWRQAVASVVSRRARSPHLARGRAEHPAVFAVALADARLALRSWRRAPAYAASAILTLGLALGLNTAIFAVIDATLLEPLPFPSGDDIVVLGERSNGSVGTSGFTTFVDWRERARAFEVMAAVGSWAPALGTDRGVTQISGMRVSHEFFRLLAAAPAIGRTFTPAEDTYDTRTVVVISDRLWRREFNADANVIGRTVQLNGSNHQVIGVMPPAFEPLVSAHFYDAADIWAPLGYDISRAFACRTCRHLRVLGRLRDDTSLAQAAADLTAVHRQMASADPVSYGRSGAVAVERLTDRLRGPFRLPLLLLQLAATLVLLIACANVGSLTLARGAAREGELAVRTALGATRGRIAGQLIVESALVAAAAAALGVMVAGAATSLILSRAPAELPRVARVGLDWSVLLYTLAIALVTALAFAVPPAFGHGKAAAAWTRATTRRETLRLREALVAMDLGVALVLLVLSGLMIQSVRHLLETPAGFNPRGVSVFRLSLVGPRWAEDAAVRAFQAALLERVNGIPGVDAAALSGQIPLGGNRDSWGASIQGRLERNEADVERYSVSPDYLRVMQIPLRVGRFFTPADDDASPPVALVSESAARQYWGDADPIGGRIRVGGFDTPWRTVVGIVGDVRHYALDEAPTPQAYFPQAQFTDSFLVLSVRSARSFDTIAGHVRSIVRETAADVPIYGEAPLPVLVAKSADRRSFLMLLLSVFAICAIAMTAVGLYGVVSYAVGRRSREVAIRLALGASTQSIRALILGRGIRLAAWGLLPGAAGAWLAGRAISAELFGVTPADPAVLSASALLLATVVLAAHAGPLRRLLRIAPSATLRSD